MNELRWILLIAGGLLIVGLYAWGMRSRTRSGVAPESARKPAVFTGTADSFETEPPGLEDTPSPIDTRRIEPSMSIDSDAAHATRSSEHTTGLAEAPEQHGGATRREPTWTPGDEAPAGNRSAGRVGATRIEPSFDSGQGTDHPRDTERGEASRETDKPARPPQKIIAMRVNAVAPARLDGARLKESIVAEGLEFGRYDIFHRMHTDGRPIFSVASLREPGTFDLQAMATTAYPGVALFTVLPGPVPAAEAVDEMVLTARALAAQLGGALADERGAPLTPLRVGRLREDALEFERSGGPA